MVDHSGSSATLASSEFRFTSADGLRIACARWDSRGPVRGVVQIAHGMGEHIGRYAETITADTAARRLPPHIWVISEKAALTCWWRTWFG